MDLDQFRGLSADAAILKAAEIAGVGAEVIDGLWRTESGRGKNMLSPAGAEGHMQIMPGTRKVFEGRFGKAIDPYNLQDALFTAAHVLKENLGRFGNIPDALRAYNGGWDKSKWGNPETSAYAARVLGEGYTATPAPQVDTRQAVVTPTAPRIDSAAAWDTAVDLSGLANGATRKEPKGTPLEEAAKVEAYRVAGMGGVAAVVAAPEVAGQAIAKQAAVQANDGMPGAAAALAAPALSELALNQQDEGMRQDSNFGDKMWKSLVNMPINAAIYQAFAKPEFETVPSFNITDEALRGYDEQERTQLLRTSSPQEFEYVRNAIADKRYDMRVVASNGMGTAVAAGLSSGLIDPASWAVGFGTMKLFNLAGVGALAMAQSGRTAGAIASATAENLLGNVAASVAEQASSGHYSLADTATAGLLALGIGPIAGAMAVRGSRAVSSGEDAARAAATQHTAYNAGLVDEAQYRAGDGATPEQVQQEMRGLEAEAVKKYVLSGTSPLSPDRRILPDLEVPQEAGTAGPVLTASDRPAPLREADAVSMIDNERDALVAEMESRYQVNDWWTGGGSRAVALEQHFESNRVSSTGTRPQEVISSLTQGELDWAKIKALPNGVHVTEALGAMPEYARTIAVVRDLAAKYLPANAKLVLGGGTQPRAQGTIITAGNTHIIGIQSRAGAPSRMVRTAVHEMGHAVWNQFARSAAPELIAGIRREWAIVAERISKEAPGNIEGRWGVTSETAKKYADKPGFSVTGNNYAASLDEYMAEQFVTHVEKLALDGNTPGFTRDLVTTLKGLLKSVVGLFSEARAARMMDPAESANKFFTNVLEQRYVKDGQQQAITSYHAQRIADLRLAKSMAANDEAVDLLVPVAQRWGFDTLPKETPKQTMEAKAMVGLAAKAEKWAATNPIDTSRLPSFLGKIGLASTAGTLLKSNNPILRYVASELLESSSGAVERKTTAAITKHLFTDHIKGASLNAYETIYAQYRKTAGGSIAEDVRGGKFRKEFDVKVAEEIESRRNPDFKSADTHPAVKAAADQIEAVHDRMRVLQKQTGTAGSGGLSDTSRGYMPHRMSPQAIRDLSPSKMRVVHAALADQFVTTSGFDPEFSSTLASKYIDRVRRQGLGGFTASLRTHGSGGSAMIEELIGELGLTAREAAAALKKFQSGAAGFTKKRTDIDLLKVYDTPEGPVRLLDVYETDQIQLIQGQIGRVSGEAALARFGIMGKGGLDIVRRAAEFGPKTTVEELKAFDQVAAEFLGMPFGTQNINVDRALQLTSLVRLGGVGFNQTAEYINGVVPLGVGRVFNAVASFARLRAEAVAISRGQDVSGYLRDVEKFAGADLGAHLYAGGAIFGKADANNALYNKDVITMGDRLLRGAMNVQSKLSFWRAMTAAQERGMGEQILQKAFYYLREGKNDTALRDMGFNDELMERLRGDLASIADFDDKGRVTSIRLENAKNVDDAEAVVHALFRGTRQIIQGTFVGETGQWAHSSGLKLLTQFKTYGITATEKQWSRNAGNYGVASSLGILLGSMSVAAPVYMARVAVSAAGRDDREEYLERRLSFDAIARATINYTASSGLAGDFIDGLSAVTGLGPEVVGGKQATGNSVIGTLVAPSAGVVADVWAGIKNDKDGTDPHQLIKSLPMSRLPWLGPAINALD